MHPKTVDWIIVGCYLLGAVLTVLLQALLTLLFEYFVENSPEAVVGLSGFAAQLRGPWILVTIANVAAVAVMLKLRRRMPLAGVAVLSVVMLFDVGLLVVPNSIALTFLLYAVPVYRDVRAAWVAFAISVVSSAFVIQLTANVSSGLIGPEGIILAGDTIAQSDRIIGMVINTLWILAVLMIGINVGNRKRYVEALIARAHQLAREREQRAQLAAAAERNRIAREMHDIVAHSLSVVVTLSEAASVAIASKPAAAQQAMEQAAETGRSALVEMRRLLGVLNEPSDSNDSAVTPTSKTEIVSPGSRAPQPGLAQLQQLIDGFARAGLDITLTETGVSSGDASQQLAVYRIVQEGLTNSLRYAGRGAQVQLELQYEPNVTRIELIDRPVAGKSAEQVPNKTLPGSGRGLQGAGERARLFGGDFVAGPHERGWRLLAHVPTHPAATAQTVEAKAQSAQATVEESK